MDLRTLPERYRLILCDLWGCVHDGRRIVEGAADTLAMWKAQGRTVLFVTNSPRSGAAIRRQLTSLGLDPALDQGIVTAGDTGLAALRGRAVGFCGTKDDRADLEAGGLVIADENYSDLACAGLEDHETVADYEEQLRAWRESGVHLHCLNPDRLSPHMGRLVVCAGALADAYEALGGRVTWYGKPFPAIYDHALALAGVNDKAAVLAIGDGLKTDMAGAAAYGLDAVYVESDLHRGEEPVFAQGWRPIGTVETIGTAPASEA